MLLLDLARRQEYLKCHRFALVRNQPHLDDMNLAKHEKLQMKTDQTPKNVMMCIKLVKNKFNVEDC